ncbi:MAG TPA: nuclear transport factor 2 family protein [Solirubrobacteraceae bacterium]|nr:nuclear transport factor 2 family protein [Solirubrobacteraceae bacterium]
MITDRPQVTPNAATIDDVDAIAHALELFIEGTAHGDQAKLAEAFHPDARMFGAIGAQRFDAPIAEFAKVVAASPADAGGTYRARITSITRAGEAACAIVVEEGFWGTVSFVDFLTLCRIDDRWRIVNKTFAHTGGEPPAPH